MFVCRACGNTGCMIDPPGPQGVVTCTKCGLQHGRFADLAALAKPPRTSPERPAPEQPEPEPEPAPAGATGASKAAATADVNAGDRKPVSLGESPAQRLLRRAPVDWAPVPDYASLSSAKQALDHLHQSGLVELRFSGTPPRRTCRWRLTDAGRRAASVL